MNDDDVEMYSSKECCKALDISNMTFRKVVKKMGINRHKATDGRFMYLYDIQEVTEKYLAYSDTVPKRKKVTKYKKESLLGTFIFMDGRKLVCRDTIEGLLIFNGFHGSVELTRSNKVTLTNDEMSRKIRSGDIVVIND